MYIDVQYPAEKQDFYKLLQEQLTLYAGGESDRTAALANASAVLKLAFPRANWAGFYLVAGDALVLGPFQGRPAVTRIPCGAGVCGTAWREGRAQVVRDVSCFEGHIACDCASHSEIVIPLRGENGAIWGVLDMDSADYAAFDEEDEAGLAACVKVLGRFGL